MNYALRLATEMARGHPEFKLPSEEAAKSLEPGDFAKLCFAFECPFPEGPDGERMWVQVMGRHGCGHYLGRLSNEPLYAPVKLGDGIDFFPEHVLAIMKKDEAVVGNENIGWTGHERNDPENWKDHGS